MRALVFFALLFSLNVYAAQNWLFQYGSDKARVVDVVTLDKNGWPKLQNRRQFKSQLAMDNYVRHLKPQIQPTKVQINKELLANDQDSLWPVTNRWSWDWEVKYAKWVKDTVTPNWWRENNLATDCADVAYSTRWIFARNNGLPMANRFGTGHWFTNRSVKPEWKRLPTHTEWQKDRRFRAALDYFLNFVFTHTLWDDSYLIAIAPDTFLPGAHHLTLHSTSGHTQLVHRVGLQPDEIPVLTVWSTTPRQVRTLSEGVFFTWANDRQGFQRMRWPIWTDGNPGLVAAEDMPFYSNEQAQPDFVKEPRREIWEEVFYRLNPNLDYGKVIDKGLNQIEEMITNRIQVVKDGYAVCQANPCIEGSAEWEAWSTPSRDQRLQDTINLVSSLFGRAGPEHRPDLSRVVLEDGGYSFTIGDFLQGWRLNLYSSDPNVPPPQRWGMRPDIVAESIAARVERLIPERDQFIQTHRECAGGACDIGSEKYLKNSPIAIDRPLLETAKTMSRYCQALRNHCPTAQSLLSARSLTAFGETLNLREWLTRTTYFNSDPRHNLEHMLWSYTHEYATLPLNEYHLYKSYNKEWFLLGRFDYKLFRRDGAQFTEWQPPAGEMIRALDAKSGWLWTAHANGLTARSSDLTQELHFAGLSFPNHLGAYNSHLLAKLDNRVVHLKIDQGKIQLVQEYPEGNFGLDDVGLATIHFENDGDILLDLIDGSSHSTGLNDVREVWRVGEDYVLRNGTCFALSGGNLIELHDSGNCDGFLAESKQIGIWNDRQLVIRTFQDWTHHQDQTLGEVHDFGFGGIRTTDGTIYCLRGQALRTHTGIPGSDRFSCNDKYLVTYNQATDQSDIWDLTTSQKSSVKGEVFPYSPNPDETVYQVILKDMKSIVDFKHPERFSLFTNIDPYRMLDPSDRYNGLTANIAGGYWLDYGLAVEGENK